MGAKSCFAGNSKMSSTGPDNDVTEVFRVYAFVQEGSSRGNLQGHHDHLLE